MWAVEIKEIIYDVYIYIYMYLHPARVKDLLVQG